MWYDIDKKAEAAMRSAEQAIRAAEQSKNEPPWDGEPLPAVSQYRTKQPWLASPAEALLTQLPTVTQLLSTNWVPYMP
jgi:hypothetical protein